MQYLFHIGQLVRFKGHLTGHSHGSTYCVVSLLPSERGGTPVYRVKNAAGTELVVQQFDLELASLRSVP